MSFVGQGSRRANQKSQNTEPAPPPSQRRSKLDQEPSASYPTSHPSALQASPRPPLQKSPSSPLVPRPHQRNDTAWRIPKSAARRPESEQLLRDSIAEDPFFSRYRTPKSERLAQDLKAQLAGVKTRGEPPEDETIRFATDGTAAADNDKFTTELSICVLGSKGVGKSTFIDLAPDVTASDADDHSVGTLVVDGTHYLLHFVELLSHDLCYQNDRHTGRPEWIDHGPMARTDGAIILFDAMKPDTLSLVPQVLDALQNARIPNVLVSSKCDVHFSKTEIEPELVEARARQLSNAKQSPQVTKEVPDTFKTVIHDLAKEIAKGGFDQPIKSTPTRQRSQSSAHAPSPTPSIKHSRAASDVSAHSIKNASLHPNAPGQYHTHGNLLAPPGENAAPNQQLRDASKASIGKPKMNVDVQAANLLHLPAENSPRSFLDLRDSLDIDVRPTLETNIALPSAITGSTGTELPAMTFEQLVERLLTPLTSRSDNRFLTMFLTFYRLFAAPSQLLDEVLKHFRSSTTPSAREQDLKVIDQWLNSYPGDFGHPLTRQKLANFLSRVAGDDRISASAHQLLPAIDIIAEDDDTTWAMSDSALIGDLAPDQTNSIPDRDTCHDSDRPDTAKTFFSTSSVDSSTASNPSTPTKSHFKAQQRFNQPAADLDSKTIFSTMSSLTLTAMGPSLQSPRTLHSLTSATSEAFSSPCLSLNVAESAQRQASHLMPTDSIPLSKTSFRTFLSLSENGIARELTRIDWIMFSSIRPRDLVRHITVPLSNRSAYRNLGNVTRMIDHFNRIAYWTTNLIILRDKPKHRAQALEKFMRIARRLREMNNYNALGAIVAGIHATPVHRLATTRALVPAEVQKNFMKLEILMGSEKGSFAYRLAWENSFGARIPFLPLHRRDLVVADQSSKTLLDRPELPAVNGSATNEDGSTGADSAPSLASHQSGVAQVQQARNKHDTIEQHDLTDTSSQTPTADQKSTKTSTTSLMSSTAPKADKAASLNTFESVNQQGSGKKYINTPKLILLSTTLLSLTKAQAYPYRSFAPQDDVRSLLLDTILDTDDEKLYQRSTVLEPAGSGGSAGLNLGLGAGLMVGDGKRKNPFPAWLAKHGLRGD